MILRISTPEDVFRSERCDLYFLDFRETALEQRKRTQHAMEVWLGKNLPNSLIEILGASEHSSAIEGGSRMLRVAFTEADLEHFMERWEDSRGRSVDSRFQCCMMAFDDWWEEHGHYCPTFERTKWPGTSHWFDTPLGILSHVVDHEKFRKHPASVQDFWENACNTWPQLTSLNLATIAKGSVRYDKATGIWILFYDACKKNKSVSADHKQIKAISKWLQLPPSLTRVRAYLE